MLRERNDVGYTHRLAKNYGREYSSTNQTQGDYELKKLLQHQMATCGLQRRRSMSNLVLEASRQSSSCLEPHTQVRNASNNGESAKEKPTIVARNELLCPICFDLMCYPVTLSCGHNFDRGCLLSAWEHGQTSRRLDADQDDDFDDPELKNLISHACPVCRKRTSISNFTDLHVNLLLKNMITAQYPLEIQIVTTEHKCQSMFMHREEIVSSSNSESPFRTAASILYVYLASVIEPPGFFVALLVLMCIVALALTPSQMISSSSTTSLAAMLEMIDVIVNGVVLMIREFSQQVDEYWAWIQLFSFLL